MKYGFLIFLFLLPVQKVLSQPCALFTQTFAVADTMKRKSEELYRFRFSNQQLDALQSMQDLEKSVGIIRKLQKTLDEDYDSYLKGIFWQLDGKLAEKHLEELRQECPQTSTRVFYNEIIYYKSKFRPKEAK